MQKNAQIPGGFGLLECFLSDLSFRQLIAVLWNCETYSWGHQDRERKAVQAQSEGWLLFVCYSFVLSF